VDADRRDVPTVVRTVGRYEITRRLGRGGMAVVHLARQTDLDRLVALKELHALDAETPSSARRFLQESRLAGSLAHPSIVHVYDYFEHDGTPFIAMEYVAGGTLRPHVGHMTFAQIAGVLEAVLAALAHAEQEGIVHRDLKPENILVAPDGRVKIADFGIAKAFNRVNPTGMLTATGMAIGTPAYMAPEQAMAGKVGPWTDLYAVGCMAFEFFTSTVPFGDAHTPMAMLVRRINEPAPSVASLNAALPDGLPAWIDSLLVKDPSKRTQSAAAAFDELEDVVIGTLGARWRRSARLPASAPTGEPVDPFAAQEAIPGPYTPPPADAVPAALRDIDPSAVDPSAGSVGSTAGDYHTYEPPPPIRPPDEADPPAATDRPAAADVPVAADPPAEAPHVQPPQPDARHEPTAAPDERPARTVPPTAPPRPRTPEQRAHTPRRRLLVVIVVALGVASAALIALIRPSDDDEGAPGPKAPGANLASGPLRLQTPAGWEQLRSAPSIPGLALTSPVAAAPAGDARSGSVLLGLAPKRAHQPSLLPDEVVESAGPGAQLDRETVALRGDIPQAYRYDGLTPAGLGRPVTLYAAPTSRGVATVVCVPPARADPELASQCRDAALSVSAPGARAFPVGPSRSYAARVNRGLGRVTSTLERGRARMRSARDPAVQASAAAGIAAAFKAAGSRLSALELSPADASTNRRLATSLGAAGSAYRELSRAAKNVASPAWERAAKRVKRAETDVASSLDALDSAGYSQLIDVRLGPQDVPALRPRPTPPQIDDPDETPPGDGSGGGDTTPDGGGSTGGGGTGGGGST
jgi:predicted Ser/Thr protein kinase